MAGKDFDMLRSILTTAATAVLLVTLGNGAQAQTGTCQ